MLVSGYIPPRTAHTPTTTYHCVPPVHTKTKKNSKHSTDNLRNGSVINSPAFLSTCCTVLPHEAADLQDIALQVFQGTGERPKGSGRNNSQWRDLASRANGLTEKLLSQNPQPLCALTWGGPAPAGPWSPPHSPRASFPSASGILTLKGCLPVCSCSPCPPPAAAFCDMLQHCWCRSSHTPTHPQLCFSVDLEHLPYSLCIICTPMYLHAWLKTFNCWTGLTWMGMQAGQGQQSRRRSIGNGLQTAQPELANGQKQGTDKSCSNSLPAH